MRENHQDLSFPLGRLTANSKGPSTRFPQFSVAKLAAAGSHRHPSWAGSASAGSCALLPGACAQ